MLAGGKVIYLIEEEKFKVLTSASYNYTERTNGMIELLFIAHLEESYVYSIILVKRRLRF